MDIDSERKDEETSDIPVHKKMQLMMIMSTLSVVRSCGNRCDVFNPTYDVSSDNTTQCYDRCVDIYSRLYTLYH